MDETLAAALRPTKFIESDAPAVVAFARETTAGCGDDVARAVALFTAVRDRIRYDPYSANLEPDTYRATTVLAAGRAYCAPKAVLFAAAARSVGIPARLGFADVKNHLATERLTALMRTDVFYFHGYAELFLEGRWLKATPTFNRELCAKLGVATLDWDGRSEALLQPFDREGRRHMEYIRDHGTFTDVPLDRIEAGWRRGYPHFFAGDVVVGGGTAGDFDAEAAAESARPPR